MTRHLLASLLLRLNRPSLTNLGYIANMNRHDEHPSKPRAPVEQQPTPSALPLSNEELRRQLGWGLIEVMREPDYGLSDRHA
jgi:hypothetical protein